MRILFAASELTPIAKVGGLGDVAGALPKALKKLGVDIRVVLPRYDVIDEKKYPLDFLGKIRVNFGQVDEIVKIYQTKIPVSEVPVYLLENENYLTGGGIYFEKSAFVGSFKEIQRFLFFSYALLEIFSVINWQPEIIHCQDWHTAIIPLLVKLKPLTFQPKAGSPRADNLKSLLTIHNLANQGRWNYQEVLNFLGLRSNDWETLKQKQFGSYGKDINIIQQGILNADIITTVSPSYAQEILTKEFGESLKGIIQKRKNDLIGILNGIDEERFSPEKDKEIKTNYSVRNIEKKQENKKDLQKITNLPVADLPLLGFISRLTDQKGSELIYQITEQLIKLNCQLVFLGQGSDLYEAQLQELAKKYPQNVYTKIGFDATLAQKIYAGADLFLVPSRFEPCGLSQMIAMRYGAIPIVRAVGGLKDSVENVKILKDGISGNGFVFDNYRSDELLKIINFALELFKNKKIWRRIKENAMKKDFSWRASAKKYLDLYFKLANLH